MEGGGDRAVECNFMTNAGGSNPGKTSSTGTGILIDGDGSGSLGGSRSWRHRETEGDRHATALLVNSLIDGKSKSNGIDGRDMGNTRDSTSSTTGKAIGLLGLPKQSKTNVGLEEGLALAKSTWNTKVV